MNNFLLVDDEDLNFIWETIQEQLFIFHPHSAPDGKFDYKTFLSYQHTKPLILIIDRYILSCLLKFCEKGYLKNKVESKDLKV